MTPAPSSLWIRNVSALDFDADTWHLQQTVTAAGVRVTSCATVLGPDDDVEVFVGEAIGPEDEVCRACLEHEQAALRGPQSQTDVATLIGTGA